MTGKGGFLFNHGAAVLMNTAAPWLIFWFGFVSQRRREGCQGTRSFWEKDSLRNFAGFASLLFKINGLVLMVTSEAG
ncbi:hypothetical protein OH491_06240 [Termitidicoccus mucosus]|uniref:hypothetical protein n=1 Tax=Termitidicoccus mucosus TaxID=1184151 RepID=UPI0011AB84A8